MPCNVGTADRAVRLVLGAVLLLLPFLTSFAATTPWLWWAAVVAGVVMLATAGLRFCPIYAVLGARTCQR